MTSRIVLWLALVFLPARALKVTYWKDRNCNTTQSTIPSLFTTSGTCVVQQGAAGQAGLPGSRVFTCVGQNVNWEEQSWTGSVCYGTSGIHPTSLTLGSSQTACVAVPEQAGTYMQVDCLNPGCPYNTPTVGGVCTLPPGEQCGYLVRCCPDSSVSATCQNSGWEIQAVEAPCANACPNPCVPDGCPSGFHCQPLDLTSAEYFCAPGESCTPGSCTQGQVCVDGVCSTYDPCLGVVCQSGYTCVPETSPTPGNPPVGVCVLSDPCFGISCPVGTYCDPSVDRLSYSCQADTPCVPNNPCGSTHLCFVVHTTNYTCTPHCSNHSDCDAVYLGNSNGTIPSYCNKDGFCHPCADCKASSSVDKSCGACTGGENGGGGGGNCGSGNGKGVKGPNPPVPKPTDAWGKPVPAPKPTDAWGNPVPQPTDAWGKPVPKPTDAWGKPVPKPSGKPDPKKSGSGDVCVPGETKAPAGKKPARGRTLPKASAGPEPTKPDWAYGPKPAGKGRATPNPITPKPSGARNPIGGVPTGVGMRNARHPTK